MSFFQSCRILPGLAICTLVAGAAYMVAHIQHALFGAGLLEPLVFAIIIGILIRTLFSERSSWKPGICFSSKTLLEIAIVLLGASISFATIRNAGLTVIVSVAAIVTLSIYVSFAVARLLGLSPRLAMLIACGNSICGNSAIVAVAPVIEASSDEVASALAFTAVLGVACVLLLPLLYFYAGLGAAQYGAIAGMTVYAVPQVLAAAAPAGLVAVQTGTVIKLLRVLMLGPVIFTLGILQGKAARRAGRTSENRNLVPWFMIGFVLVVIVRSLGLIPMDLVTILLTISSGLTVIAMAGLGLSVDIRAVASAGGRVILASSISLLLLITLSYFVVVAALHS